VLVQEKFSIADDGSAATSSGIIIDKWCVIAEVSQEEECAPSVKNRGRTFDLDTYKILRGFLTEKLHKLVIQPLGPQQLAELGI
jgi:hypothetical protein